MYKLTEEWLSDYLQDVTVVLLRIRVMNSRPSSDWVISAKYHSNVNSRTGLLRPRTMTWPDHWLSDASGCRRFHHWDRARSWSPAPWRAGRQWRWWRWWWGLSCWHPGVLLCSKLVSTSHQALFTWTTQIYHQHFLLYLIHVITKHCPSVCSS